MLRSFSKRLLFSLGIAGVSLGSLCFGEEALNQLSYHTPYFLPEHDQQTCEKHVRDQLNGLIADNIVKCEISADYRIITIKYFVQGTAGTFITSSQIPYKSFSMINDFSCVRYVEDHVKDDLSKRIKSCQFSTNQRFIRAAVTLRGPYGDIPVTLVMPTHRKILQKIIFRIVGGPGEISQTLPDHNPLSSYSFKLIDQCNAIFISPAYQGTSERWRFQESTLSQAVDEIQLTNNAIRRTKYRTLVFADSLGFYLYSAIKNKDRDAKHLFLKPMLTSPNKFINYNNKLDPINYENSSKTVPLSLTIKDQKYKKLMNDDPSQYFTNNNKYYDLDLPDNWNNISKYSVFIGYSSNDDRIKSQSDINYLKSISKGSHITIFDSKMYNHSGTDKEMSMFIRYANNYIKEWCVNK